MTKTEFLALLGKAYHFPEYYSLSLDSADEILAERQEEEEVEKLSLAPLFFTLLEEVTQKEQEKIWALIMDHFAVKSP